MLEPSAVRLRDYPVLHTVANNIFSSAAVHDVDQVVTRGALGAVQVSRIYAETLMAALAGRLSDAARDRFAAVYEAAAPMVRARAPTAFVRLAALAELIGLGPGLVDGTDPREDAVGVQREMSRAAASDGYDRATSLPLFTGPAAGDPGAVLGDLERLRAGARWYELTVVAPHDGREISDVAHKETPLLQELRALRLVQLLPDLPRHYQYAQVNVTDEENYMPLREAINLERAERRIAELVAELQRCWREGSGGSGAATYGRRRLQAVPTLAEFRAALRAP